MVSLNQVFIAIGASVFLLLTACAKIDDPMLSELKKYDPATAQPPPEKSSVERSETRNLLWGDVHIHSSLSYDSYTAGSRTLPDDAYTFMKGGTIAHGAGYAARAKRPLDFGAVTDHVEYLGVPRYQDGAKKSNLPEILATGSPLRITWNLIRSPSFGSHEAREEAFGVPGMEEVSSAAWRQIIEAAARHNDPGRFTAFIGYEWSSMPGEQNLHRVVIYKDSQAPDFPFSSRDSDNPEDLWSALEEQREQGMQVFAIPHNGNASNGLMYDSKAFKGGELDAEYARRRTLNEPLSEIFQAKGSSETHPSLSPDDPFAGFEIMDQILSEKGGPSQPSGSYTRDALRTGIEFAASRGFNPYRFGVIGSSDSHNSTFIAEEDNHFGKLAAFDGTPGLRLGEALMIPDEMVFGKKWSAQGLAAVWAHENTRASLFEAMERKETYATSGPRMALRFFGGWHYIESLLEQADWLGLAYANGVPMGGILTAGDSEASTAPGFILSASKDPAGANLDRLQVIKAWVDAKGNSHEKVFDVAGSDGRVIDAQTGLFPAVGNTVNIADASYSNTIGAPQLSALWQDPEFDPGQHAVYYARVIEIPTPRHTTYAARDLGVEAPKPSSIQERAVSSAIWYQP